MLIIKQASIRARRQKVDDEESVALLVGNNELPTVAIQLSLKAARLLQAELGLALTQGAISPEDEARLLEKIASMRREVGKQKQREGD